MSVTFYNNSAKFSTTNHYTAVIICLRGHRRGNVFGKLFLKRVALLMHGVKLVVKVVNLLLLRYDEREQYEQ